ncbi:MAG: hypothetical protein IJH20_03790 [Bacilli bacterium]|nr:hypothetical protein [Bacilli bacterium]
MDIIDISREKLDSFRTIKKDIVWVDNNYVYKKDFTFERKKDLFEILRTFEETKDCILPEKNLYLNGNPFGYITKYDKEKDKLTKRIIKGDLLHKEKLLIIRELIRIIKEIHSVGFTHGDFHTDNILYSKNGVKLIDFDNSTLSGESTEIYHNGKIKADMALLNIDILNILGDKVITVESQLIPFIKCLDISEDYKSYLIASISYKDSVKEIYPDKYLEEINGKLETQVRKLIRSIK